MSSELWEDGKEARAAGQMGGAHRYEVAVGAARTDSNDPDGWRAARRRFPGSGAVRRSAVVRSL